MSADNGIHIQKTQDNKYWKVYEYCASVDYDDPTQMYPIGEYPTLEAAIKAGQEQQTEYGLSFTL